MAPSCPYPDILMKSHAEQLCQADRHTPKETGRLLSGTVDSPADLPPAQWYVGKLYGTREGACPRHITAALRSHVSRGSRTAWTSTTALVRQARKMGASFAKRPSVDFLHVLAVAFSQGPRTPCPVVQEAFDNGHPTDAQGWSVEPCCFPGRKQAIHHA